MSLSTSRRVAALSRHLADCQPDLMQSVNVTPEFTSAHHSHQGSSVWESVPQAPADAILGISEAYKKDADPSKLNLGVGAYRTEEGKPLVLEVVKSAEQLILSQSRDKEYAGIGGDPEFCELSARLAFGETSRILKEKRVATVQSLSGTGALRVGAEFLAEHWHQKVVYVPNPTWANHNKIFPRAGLALRQYRYYLPATRLLDFQGMMEDLSGAPEGAVVLLHACAHNPTGVDPTPDQWKAILRVVQQRSLLPFFDSAYQGFASGDLDKDAFALRLFADAGVELLLAQSFAKNMGLYGERVGALSVVSASAPAAGRVASQLKAVIRPMYSSPPRHGAEIATTVLSSPDLFRQWKVELKGMADRILSMREGLHSSLLEIGAPGDWSHIVKQIGMFTYTGLTPAQVENMTGKWHIYMTKDGRISLAGLSSTRCRYVAEAIADSVRSC